MLCLEERTQRRATLWENLPAGLYRQEGRGVGGAGSGFAITVSEGRGQASVLRYRVDAISQLCITISERA